MTRQLLVGVCRLPAAPSLLALAGLFGLAGAARAAEAPVTFTFSPPANGQFLQREIFVETGRVGGIQKLFTMAAETAVSVSREPGNVLLRYRIERAAAARDGKASDAAMVAGMTGAETVNVVRQNGVLARVDGMRRLHERLLSTLAGEERDVLERRLRENRIEDRLRANWFESTEILAGQTLDLDRDYFFDAAWPTDDGWVPHQTLLRLGPWEETRFGRRLWLHLSYVPNARAAAPGATKLEAKSASALAPGKVAKGLSISGQASRLVDPQTLLVYKDQTVRLLRNQVRVSEELALTVSTEEKSDLTLEPATPGAPPKNH